MSAKEMTSIRDLAYSQWHRVDSIQRYIGEKTAKEMTMQDIDFVEYDYKTGAPLIFVEIAVYNGRIYDKLTNVIEHISNTYHVAYGVCIPCLLVFYELSDETNPFADVLDIKSFRVIRRDTWGDSKERYYSPKEYVELLVSLREESKQQYRDVVRD